MLKKITEIILIFFALAVFLVLSAVLSLKIAFPESKLKQLCCDGILGYTSREASFKSINWGLNGINIEGASISARFGFGQGTFLTVDKINYKPDFLPGKTSGLLTVDSPNILTEYFPESLGLKASTGGQQGAIAASRKAHFIPFSAIKVINGGITFKNKEIAVKKIEVVLKKGRAPGVFEGVLSADVVRGKEKLGVASDVSIDYMAGTVQFNNAKIQVERAGSIAVSGQIKEFASAKNIECDFNIKGDRRALDKVLELLPGNLSGVQYGTKQEIDLNISAGSGELKIRDNLMLRKSNP